MSSAGPLEVTRRLITQIQIKGPAGTTLVVVRKFRGWEECDAGSIAITGAYGPWEYTWSSIGECTFGQFLKSLNMPYAMEKLAGSEMYEFDADATLKAVRAYICEARKHDSLSKDKARGFFDLAEGMKSASCPYEAYAGDREDLVWQLMDGEPITRKRVKEGIREFWDSVWPAIVNEILAMESEAAAQAV